jgi:16S rRNA A1518/A1519 N6-dimethyltransferase RsmA/KsgA/DIM1 with predicted DNA glycosylase/AP lyase activity
VRGGWDYRPNIDDYIGRLDCNRKRVVEIDPANGYLTRAMEQHGEDVLCIDTNPDAAWDTVPRLDRNAPKLAALEASQFYHHQEQTYLYI